MQMIKLLLPSHHKSILWSKSVMRDLWLGSQVRGCVIVGGDKLCVLVFVELIGSRLQHSLLQLDTPLELHVTKRTERHEKA